MWYYSYNVVWYSVWQNHYQTKFSSLLNKIPIMIAMHEQRGWGWGCGGGWFSLILSVTLYPMWFLAFRSIRLLLDLLILDPLIFIVNLSNSIVPPYLTLSQKDCLTTSIFEIDNQPHLIQIRLSVLVVCRIQHRWTLVRYIESNI